MNKTLILALLPIAVGANANCVTDAPEIGDIGPGSELVCNRLTQRFPSAALAVEGRTIHSPAEVRVTASVDGRPIVMDYRLAGFTWVLNGADARTAKVTD
jgi:hypothetical protein